jgi:hypothetical protein
MIGKTPRSPGISSTLNQKESSLDNGVHFRYYNSNKRKDWATQLRFYFSKNNWGNKVTFKQEGL